jgi:hypothetical protein
MDNHIRKALSQHGGLLATLAKLAINSSLLFERIRKIAVEAAEVQFFFFFVFFCFFWVDLMNANT